MDAGPELSRDSHRSSPSDSSADASLASVLIPPEHLDADRVQAVLTAARATEKADGLPPLNDDQLIALEQPDAVPADTVVQHLWLGRATGVSGYAQLATTDAEAVGTLFVPPDRRRRGAGRTLLRAALGQASTLDSTLDRTLDTIRLWAPGDHPGARRLAETHGFSSVRELLIMARDLDDTVPDGHEPAGVTIRAFTAADEDAFLTVNARAFAHHPEQGRLDHLGFRAKASEPWFDPAGFFLALDPEQTDPSAPGHTTDGRVLGFHWTKNRGDGVGEVYVIGVDPDAEGRGLAKALLSRGLRQLRAQGCRSVILYVEGDHDRAVGLYQRYGFAVSRRDVMYAHDLDGETKLMPPEEATWT